MTLEYVNGKKSSEDFKVGYIYSDTYFGKPYSIDICLEVTKEHIKLKVLKSFNPLYTEVIEYDLHKSNLQYRNFVDLGSAKDVPEY